jgi:hypothetical protein
MHRERAWPCAPGIPPFYGAAREDTRWQPLRVAIWEALYLLSLVLRSWERVKPVRLANIVPLLDRHIRRHLV